MHVYPYHAAVSPVDAQASFCIETNHNVTFLSDFALLQRRLWSLSLHAFWIPLTAILGEAVQHAVEFKFGMYVLGDGISPGAETWIRTAAAAIKAASFIATILMTIRFFENARQGADADDQRASTHSPYGLAVTVVAITLPVIAHYALNFGAVGRPPALVIGLLSIDVIVTGWLSISVGATLARLRNRGSQA